MQFTCAVQLSQASERPDTNTDTFPSPTPLPSLCQNNCMIVKWSMDTARQRLIGQTLKIGKLERASLWILSSQLSLLQYRFEGFCTIASNCRGFRMILQAGFEHFADLVQTFPMVLLRPRYSQYATLILDSNFALRMRKYENP